MRWWNKKQKRFGDRNWGERKIGTCTVAYATDCIKVLAEYYDLDPSEQYNNAWARKTYNEFRIAKCSLLVTLALGELLMSEERVQSESRLAPNRDQSGFNLARQHDPDAERLRKVG